MSLKELDVSSLSFSPFNKIGKEWMLVTAGDAEKHNTMTASWGGMGVIWGVNAVTVYIRPQRYTFEFVEANEYFSLCFFNEKYRDALNFCGSKSGRDYDKPKETGLTADFSLKAPFYKEASLVFVCRKLYSQDFKEELFLERKIVDSMYPNRDLHRMYIGGIEKALGV